jgi:hypothetical protein
MNDTKKYNILNLLSIDSLFNFEEPNNSVLTIKSSRTKKGEKLFSSSMSGLGATRRLLLNNENLSVSNFNNISHANNNLKLFSSETSIAKKAERDSPPMLDLKLNNSFSENNNINNFMTYERVRDENEEYIYDPKKPLLNLDYIEQTKLLVRQYDMMIQLLIQNILLTNDPELKLENYTMLYNFYNMRTRVLAYMKLPQYDVMFKFCGIFNENKPLVLKPQVSLFQSPLLDIVPVLVKFMNM